MRGDGAFLEFWSGLIWKANRLLELNPHPNLVYFIQLGNSNGYLFASVDSFGSTPSPNFDMAIILVNGARLTREPERFHGIVHACLWILWAVAG